MLTLALCAQIAPTPLDELLSSPSLKGAVYSVCVTKLDGAVLYDRNSSLRLLPASNEKLFTAAYALSTLGTDYKPQTRFWRLKDRIIVDTTGDPMLSYDDLVKAKQTLKLDGKLPVYVHEPYRIGYLPQWELDDLPNKYGAPVTAFTVDRGAFEIWEDSDHAYFKPEDYGTRVVRSRVGRRHVKYDPFTKTAHVYGPMPREAALLDTLSLPEPDRCAASILGSSFHLTSKVPETTPDLVLEGPALPVILKECLVHSDNNLAENLLLLSACKEGDLGDQPYDTAANREKAFAQKTLGIDPDDFQPNDGSGLSRTNWTTTHSIAALLQWQSKQPFFDLWKGFLASPGNGTLKKRLEGSSFMGKTGSMDGVSALSGYVKTKDGQTVIVSMIFNNLLCPDSKIHALQDDFVRKIEASTLSGTVLEGAVKRESHSANPSPGSVPTPGVH